MIKYFAACRADLCSLVIYTALFAILAGALFTAVACRQDSGDAYMLIDDPRSGRVYYREAIDPGIEFTLAYRHSVSRSRVEGSFLVTEEGTIKPLTTSYSSFGPGLPLDYVENYTIEDGMITVYHEEEPRETIRLWVSTETGEIIYIQDRELPLAALSDAPLLLEISITKNFN